MTKDETRRLQCENAYLKARCTQLEASIADLDAQLVRTSHREVRPEGRRGRWHVNLMSGGQ
jgi:cell division protein FtsB